jgi:hypothetical protein
VTVVAAGNALTIRAHNVENSENGSVWKSGLNEEIFHEEHNEDVVSFHSGLFFGFVSCSF